MVRLTLVLLFAVAALVSPLATNASAQVTVWCPAGDGPVVAGPLADRSIDLDFSGAVNLADFAAFAASYPAPPALYVPCRDFNNSGTINLADFVLFAGHWLHAGPVIGLCI